MRPLQRACEAILVQLDAHRPSAFECGFSLHLAENGMHEETSWSAMRTHGRSTSVWVPSCWRALIAFIYTLSFSCHPKVMVHDHQQPLHIRNCFQHREARVVGFRYTEIG